MLRNLRELHQYRTLLWSLTQRELRARYRASVLGFLWTFLNPTLHMLVYALVFGVFMRQSVPQYTYFLFTGLLPWLWFSSSLGGGASAISDRRDLLTKVRFPAQVLPASVVATNLCNFVLSLPLMILLGALYGSWPTWHIVATPLVVLTQLLFTLALTYMFSAMNVRFRDLQHIVGNLLTFWFFATPIIYPTSGIPERFRALTFWGNPMAPLIDSYRKIFYEHQLPDPAALVYVMVLSIVLLWIGSAIFDARREEFAEVI